MKTMKFAMFMPIFFLSFALSSCSGTNAETDELLASIESELKDGIIPGCINQGDPGTVTESEIAGLMEMREEEKLAHDVYVKFYSLYKIPVFNNIPKSETAHQKAVLYLIDLFKLKDPSKPKEGEFSNSVYAELYPKLIKQGSVSAAEALKASAFIEEHDIDDLMKLLEKTQNTNIKRVYTNLLTASKIHLKAFTNVLAVRYKETYKPSILPESLYNEIKRK
jgi:hypothetical protein